MTNKEWCANMTSDDCVTDGEWDIMTEYIKHHSVTDFTIHDTRGTCSDTGQAFRFTMLNGTQSAMYGTATSGDDLIIYANSADGCPSFTLEGGGNATIRIPWNADFEIATCSDELIVRFDIVKGKSRWFSSENATDNLEIWANTAGYPYIALVGNAEIAAFPASGSGFYISPAGTRAFLFDASGNTSRMYGQSASADDLVIYANGSDALPLLWMDGGNGNIQINSSTPLSANFDLALLGDGVLCIKETSTPTADANYGKIYCKNDNRLYFQDGAGVEHAVTVDA